MDGKLEDQMNARRPTKSSAIREQTRDQLSALRLALLALHKALVDSERISYETTVGQIQSPSHFLQLLARDAWFTWLQPFSQLIVAMDEALEEKTPLTTANGAKLVKQTRRLLVASENGEGFSGHYYAALQRDPDVVMARAEVAKVIKRLKPPTPPQS